MSCLTSNAPIDIIPSNSSGICDTKCDYKFKYQNSSCVGKNLGKYILLSYDNSSSVVTYNMIHYNVDQVRIYSPSLHSFNGNKTDAEMIIIHISNTGEAPLLVCLPIKISNSSTSMLSTIISTMQRNAPTEGDSTTIMMNDYNLGKIIPKGEFHTYVANEPYQPCSEMVNYIVYDANNSSLSITKDVHDNLIEIIADSGIKSKVNGTVQFFTNPKGSNTMTEDDIYIDCSPVGESEENTTVVNNYNSDNDNSWNNLKKNVGFQMFIGIILFAIILIIFNYLAVAIGLIGKSSGNLISNITSTG